MCAGNRNSACARGGNITILCFHIFIQWRRLPNTRGRESRRTAADVTVDRRGGPAQRRPAELGAQHDDGVQAVVAALVHRRRRRRRGRRGRVGGGRFAGAVVAAVDGRLSPSAEHFVSFAPTAAAARISRIVVDRRRRGRIRRRGRRRYCGRRRVALPFDQHVADNFARLRVHLQHVGSPAANDRCNSRYLCSYLGYRFRRHGRGRWSAAVEVSVVVFVVVADVHCIGKRDRLLAGRRDRTAAVIAALRRQRRYRRRRYRFRFREHHAGRRQTGNHGRVMFGRRVHAGLLYGAVQQSRAVRLQVQP